ncbi:hypothetical protein [Sulfitobacter sp. R18_1]|uniref:hypothetical protein n=1 Tax=Sulfitobacter sp. R18_1 TaxID=2821104 RepID=UPI001ADC2D57|nr:hypothetical protein [Sulfitobacter sp. R18_1]MBO9428162.1 hypothetical protein [Sulfitobacter sp. R18_1]
MPKFSWGRVIEDVEIGPYMIRSFHPHKLEGSTITREIDTTEVHYHGYVDGEDTRRAWKTLEDAMAGLIVYAALGPNYLEIGSHFVAGVNALAKED